MQNRHLSARNWPKYFTSLKHKLPTDQPLVSFCRLDRKSACRWFDSAPGHHHSRRLKHAHGVAAEEPPEEQTQDWREPLQGAIAQGGAGDLTRGNLAITGLLKRQRRLVARDHLGAKLRNDALDGPAVSVNESVSHEICDDLMVSEQRAQDLESQSQRFGRDVHRHPLEDEDRQRGARMRLQLFLKRFFLEIDRDPA